MRYLEPGAGRIQRASYRWIEMGDSFPATMVGFSSTITIPLAIGAIVDAGLLIVGIILFLPTLLSIVAVLIYFTQTKNIGRSHSGDEFVNKAIKLLDQIHEPYARSLALPIARKIYNHAMDHSSSYYASCDSCEKRVDTLRDLVPAQVSPRNYSDVETAQEYINIRKELT